MKKIEFRPLRPEEIEVRPATTDKNGKITLLLYIDSRCAANILNEAVGEYDWQMEYKDVAGQIYGRLSIWDEDKGMWVYKEDTGSESNIEAAKGLSSDILKRCLARWGCDYLYTAPRIKINGPENYFLADKLTMTFSVSSISYDGKRISALTIVDRFGNEVFNWKASTANEPREEMRVQARQETPAPQTDEQRRLAQLQDWYLKVQGDPAFDQAEVQKFYDHYLKQTATFKYKNFDFRILWDIWMKKKWN